MDRREARLLGHCRRCCNGINFASFGFSTEHLAQHGVRRRLMWRVAGCVRGCSASLLSLYTDLYEKARQEVWEQTCPTICNSWRFEVKPYRTCFTSWQPVSCLSFSFSLCQTNRCDMSWLLATITAVTREFTHERERERDKWNQNMR